ncbi:30S ribosomal protein S17 [Spiroplasma endosymbiont of Amphimallon solstitiale]|uniref:30S ribosomal protein S17 n=1 Tax=Spiroplasma endosymbiont of Amphimallon solstitiale TaxID=3066288 RepID=UPI00313D5B4C
MTNIIPNKQRKTFVGIVSSDKNDKTITVVVETSKQHPMYHKSFKSTKKYHAHDETNQAKIGDKVEIISTRPLSALKRFRLLKIIESKTNKKA